MIVAVKDQGRARRQAHAPTDPGVRRSRARWPWDPGVRGSLRARCASGAGRGHGALAAQRAVGEVVEEPAVGADGEVGVEGEELGELEGLEAVDDEGFGEWRSRGGARGGRGGSVDRGGRHGGRRWCGRCRGRGRSDAGRRPRRGGRRWASEEIATAEPVGGGEGGGGEASAAGATAEVLEATVVGGSDVVTVADEVPAGSGDGSGSEGWGSRGAGSPRSDGNEFDACGSRSGEEAWIVPAGGVSCGRGAWLVERPQGASVA